jgi:hypothetical protein
MFQGFIEGKFSTHPASNGSESTPPVVVAQSI